jgi:hypothetical protein
MSITAGTQAQFAMLCSSGQAVFQQQGQTVQQSVGGLIIQSVSQASQQLIMQVSGSNSIVYAVGAGTATGGPVQFTVQSGGQTVLSVGAQNVSQRTIITGGVIQNQQTQQVSDIRIKNPVRQLYGGALSNIATLQGFLYEESELVKTLKFSQPQPIMAGLSAQEVQVFAPEIVSSKGFTVEDYEGNEETFLTLDYSRLSPYLVEAIKELKERVETLEAWKASFTGNSGTA